LNSHLKETGIGRLRRIFVSLNRNFRNALPIVGKYCWEAVTHPKASAHYLRWRLSSEQRILEDFAAGLIGREVVEVGSILREVESTEFEHELRNRLKEVPYSGWLTFSNGRILYLLTRLLRPKLVVETGVFAGVSSAFILKALDFNGSGELYSIDLPDPFWKKIGKQPGFAVSRELKKNWNLTLGRSCETLERLLTSLRSIDFFFHDSDHSYENMLYEFTTVWTFLAPGGLLLSDNIDMNRSFDEFCRGSGAVPVKTTSSFTKYGATLKPKIIDTKHTVV
jgi:predicted O-methyltransferase YrrM